MAKHMIIIKYRNVSALYRLTFGHRPMFRCHFTRNGRIVAGENLSAATLEQAVAEAEALLAAQQGDDQAEGFEIWTGTSLLYTSS